MAYLFIEVAADQCQSIGQVNAACRLEYPSGWLTSTVVLTRKPQAFGSSNRAQLTCGEMLRLQLKEAYEVHL